MEENKIYNMNISSDFTTDIEGDIFIIKVNLTRATFKEVRELNKLLSNAVRNGYKKILIEMNEIEFIDSTFIGVLVINLKKIIKVKGNLNLVGLRPSVQTIVDNSNLQKIFNIFVSKKEALKSL